MKWAVACVWQGLPIFAEPCYQVVLIEKIPQFKTSGLMTLFFLAMSVSTSLFVDSIKEISMTNWRTPWDTNRISTEPRSSYQNGLWPVQRIPWWHKPYSYNLFSSASHSWKKSALKTFLPMVRIKIDPWVQQRMITVDGNIFFYIGVCSSHSQNESFQSRFSTDRLTYSIGYSLWKLWIFARCQFY